MPFMMNRTILAGPRPRCAAATTLLTLLLCLLIATIPTPTTAASCTLCKGSSTVPDPDAMIDGISCQMLSMALVFIPEDDVICENERERSKVTCGCKDATDIPSVSPSSAPSMVLSVPPTMTSEKEVNCQALMAGSYPSFSSSASNVEVVVLKYHANVYFQQEQQPQQYDQQGVLDDFEDAASRVVSAGAAGCYDRRNTKQRRTRYLRQHNNIQDHEHDDKLLSSASFSFSLIRDNRELNADDNDQKIHFVQFNGLRVQSQESCSTITKNTDGCRVVQGRIGVVYSPISSGDNGRGRGKALQKASVQWARDAILPIFNERKASIISAVDGIRDFDQVVSEANGDDDHDYDRDNNDDHTPSGMTTSESNDRTTIGIAVGCSAFALLVSVCSWFLIQRRKRNKSAMNFNSNNKSNKKEKKNTKGGNLRSRGLLNSSKRLSKKVERVDIISNYHIQSDDSFVEYVDSNAICCDDSVSNAPTVAYKKVNSLESTILTKSHSFDSSSNDNDEGSFPLNTFDDSSMESSSSSSLKMDEFSQMSPYDEMASDTRQKTFPIKSNQIKSVRFLNDMGEEHHLEKSIYLPPEQAPSSTSREASREGRFKNTNEEEGNSIENTVDL
eukprot:CAMPEP_0203678532 /NCGR_PEP_ID=MMETSP0090-20130426/32335_1 /ASSEMBLY_ACC=CAM_ASM_001088 /TAXON_ID=426623 /ORGANISM="Chaetoceros affinis, Strain CCMP159" /LENGTH=614 /DNA_ID=CAMNT_0050545819 /DNA_START=17 /DNA_END=1861 /DNA_ORIENTATION=+